jgi:hypothetical protein
MYSSDYFTRDIDIKMHIYVPGRPFFSELQIDSPCRYQVAGIPIGCEGVVNMCILYCRTGWWQAK